MKICNMFWALFFSDFMEGCKYFMHRYHTCVYMSVYVCVL